MPGPELEIIRSPEAKMFLRAVTKGFYDQSALGLWMFEAIGREWDEMAAWSNALKQEIFVQTCTWSIGIWEWVYGFEPDETMTLPARRQRILAKIRALRPINPENLRRGIAAASGADVELRDFTRPYGFHVTLRITDSPVPIDRVTQYIHTVKPAHLMACVDVVFPTVEHVLRTGGGAAAHVRLPVPEAPDVYASQYRVGIGISTTLRAELPVPEQTS